jgi:hypothetical protein
VTNEQFAARLMNLMDATLVKGPALRTVLNTTTDAMVDFAHIRAGPSDAVRMVEQCAERMRSRSTADA